MGYLHNKHSLPQNSIFGQSIRPSISLSKNINSCLIKQGLCFESPRGSSTASFPSHGQIPAKSREQNRDAGKPTGSNVLSLCENSCTVTAPLSDTEQGGKQADRDLHRTQHPPKASTLLCFSHAFSHLSSATITRHPRSTTYTQDRMKGPSYSLSGLRRHPGYTIMHSKATTIPRSRAFPSHPSLGFVPGRETGSSYLPFSRSPGKTPPPLGNLTAPGSAPCPFLPFLLHITHVSHHMSYQSLQQMHSLPPAREKAATAQSCNLITACNEMTGKYFCLIRILNKLLIIMSGSWLASHFVPPVMVGQLLASSMYLFPSAQHEEV